MNIVKFTVDSFQNFAARVGLGSGNQHDQSQYNFDFVSRDRLQLEAMYRSSWVVGQVVDVVAEDMTEKESHYVVLKIQKTSKQLTNA
jgi:hypothetical protein